MSRFSKLLSGHFWYKHLSDRLNEPFLINLLAFGALVFGSPRTKIAFDMFEQRPYAFGILAAADMAKQLGIPRIGVVEFGVASGNGLLSMSRIAAAVAKDTGVRIDVFGFDTGGGMPPPVDYRDHPEYYSTGDYPMDQEGLRKRLPAHTQLILGNVSETVPQFTATYEGVIGFVSIDVDYYSSAVACMELLEKQSANYLPVTPLYFDDVFLDAHNEWAGERLVIREFNDRWPMRKISLYTFLREKRIIKNAVWIRQMYAMHVLDHPARTTEGAKKEAELRRL